MNIENLIKYADVLLQKGINLQENQPVLINGAIENADFVRILVKEAYRLGAKEVIVNWRDGEIAKERLLHADVSVLENPKSWIPEYYHNMLDENVGIISLVSANPELLKGVPADRISLNSRSIGKELRFFNEAVMNSELTWCVAAVPTLLWANLIGLTGTDNEKVAGLWDIILTLCRIDNVSEEESFENHMNNLEKRTIALNKLNLKELRYSCSNGTKLTVKLPENHIWLGGAESSTKNVIFNANIPTEEVFSAPLRTGVDGIVYNTKPLIYHGNKIDGFCLHFEDGKIVDFEAKEGQEILKELIKTDKGSCYLGEVALVDHYSPISESNKIYFETLFDENASCHLAIGAAYPICVKDGQDMEEDELIAAGLNQSMTHVDFMIGHEDMNIEGINQNGESIQIMENGRLKI